MKKDTGNTGTEFQSCSYPIKVYMYLKYCDKPDLINLYDNCIHFYFKLVSFAGVSYILAKKKMPIYKKGVCV